MRKKSCFLIMVIISILLLVINALSEANNEWLGKWYLYSFQDQILYPDTVFLAGYETEYIDIYTNGTDLIAVFNNECGHIERTVRDCILDGDTMNCMGSYTLEEGQLIRKIEYNDEVEAVYVYTRDKPESRFADFNHSYFPLESVKDVNGTWTISQYGMNRAYANAADMNMSGTASFYNGKLTMSWTRDGIEKNGEIIFDQELNNGRLYTVIDGATSYIVTKLSNNTLLLNIGLNSIQWVFIRAEE